MHTTNSKYSWEFFLQSSSGSLVASTKDAILPPIEWEDLTIETSFEEYGSDTINVGEFTFTGEAYNNIKDKFDNGKVLQNHELAVRLRESRTSYDDYVFNDDGTYEFISRIGDDFTVFILDFTNITFFEHESKVTVGVINKESGSSMVDKLNATTFGALFQDSGRIKTEYLDIIDKIPVIVEKEDTAIEQLILYITIYNLTTELANQVSNTGRSLASIKALIIMGPGSLSTGFAAAAAKLLLEAAIQIALLFAMSVALITLLRRIEELLFPSPIYKYGFNLGLTVKAMFKEVDGSDVRFLDSVKDVNKYYYLPSNITGETSFGSTESTFSPSDYGYMFSEFLDMIKKLFEVKITRVGNEIIIGHENDDFFYKNSTYVLPSVLIKDQSYNVKDFNSREVYAFRTDSSDDFTTSNYRGTSYEVYNDIGFPSQINKLKDVNHNLSLASRKNQLSIIQNLLGNVVNTINKLIGFFSGGGANSKSKFSNQIGMVKVSHKAWSVPKLLRFDQQSGNFKLDRNHSELTTAKHFYENYNYLSGFEFARNRRKLYKNVRVDFDLRDWKILKQNSVFTTDDNETGRITSLQWNVQGDYADIEYYITGGFNTEPITKKFTEA